MTTENAEGPNITKLRKLVVANETLSSRDQVKDLEQESGIVMLNSLYSEGIWRAYSPELRGYVTSNCSVSQFGKNQTSFALPSVTAKTRIIGIESTGHRTILMEEVRGTACAVNAASRVDEQVPASALGISFGKRNQQLVKGTSASIGAIMTGPTLRDESTLAYLAEITTRTTDTWVDEAPFLRCMLLNESQLGYEDWLHDIK